MEEIERIAQFGGKNVDGFRIVEGDISEPGLALNAADLEMVQQLTTRVFHLAAVYELAIALNS